MKKIVVIGSSNTDMVIKSDKLPNPGETILGGEFLLNPGGKGANQAVTAARLGGKVTFIAKIGSDAFGKNSINLYSSEGINTEFIFSDPEKPSGVALINVNESGENCIVVAPGANGLLSVEDIEKAKCEIESADILLMQLEIPLSVVEYSAKLAYEKGIKVILNPAPANELSNSLLKCLYIITPNKNEAEALSGIKITDIESAKRAAAVIRGKGVDTVIITMGELGAIICDDQLHQIPAVNVETVDTTAAGDVFNGALSVALAEDKSIVDAVIFACKCAALSVTKLGAQSSIPYRNNIV